MKVALCIYCQKSVVDKVTTTVEVRVAWEQWSDGIIYTAWTNCKYRRESFRSLRYVLSLLTLA